MINTESTIQVPSKKSFRKLTSCPDLFVVDENAESPARMNSDFTNQEETFEARKSKEKLIVNSPKVNDYAKSQRKSPIQYKNTVLESFYDEEFENTTINRLTTR